MRGRRTLNLPLYPVAREAAKKASYSRLVAFARLHGRNQTLMGLEMYADALIWINAQEKPNKHALFRSGGESHVERRNCLPESCDRWIYLIRSLPCRRYLVVPT